MTIPYSDKEVAPAPQPHNQKVGYLGLRKRYWLWIMAVVIALVVLGVVVGIVEGTRRHGNSVALANAENALLACRAGSVMSPANSTASVYGLNILSASYGDLDVTAKLRNAVSTNPLSVQNRFNFTPSDAFFGQASLPNNPKACVAVYSVSNNLFGQPPVNGPPQVYRGLEGVAAVISYDTIVQSFVAPCPPNNRFIVDATWYTKDVTSTISARSDASSSSLNISVDVSTLGPDPAPNILKQLTITYSFVDSKGMTQFALAIGKDADTIQIPRGPPVPLAIYSTIYGGIDVTDKAQALITTEQTWNLPPNNVNTTFGDPWWGIVKSICVLYRYGNRPLELLVNDTYSNDFLLDPYAPVNPVRYEFLRPQEPKVLAIIWGIMQNQTGPLPESKFQEVSSSGTFNCSDAWMGFNGWIGVPKTCVVFARAGNGSIYGASVREGQIGLLHS